MMHRAMTVRTCQQVRAFASAANGETVEAGAAARAVLRAVQCATVLPRQAGWETIEKVLGEGIRKGSMLALMHAKKSAEEVTKLDEPEKATEYLRRVANGLVQQQPPLLALKKDEWMLTTDGLRAMVGQGPIQVTLTETKKSSRLRRPKARSESPPKARIAREPRPRVPRAPREPRLKSTCGPLEVPSIPVDATEDTLREMKEVALKLVADEKFILRFLGDSGAGGLQIHANRLIAAQSHLTTINLKLRKYSAAHASRNRSKATAEAPEVVTEEVAATTAAA